MSESESTILLKEIRNWIRASSFMSVRALLVSALPDEQTRKGYQLLDGQRSIDQVRAIIKMGPNKLASLAQKWTSMGLMELTLEKKRKRLFDLEDFELITPEVQD